MKILAVSAMVLCCSALVFTGCYLSIDNSTGWAFPIVFGLLGLGFADWMASN